MVDVSGSGGYSESLTEQYLFKFIIVGDEGVGKTCLLLQFTDGRYTGSGVLTYLFAIPYDAKLVDVD